MASLKWKNEKFKIARQLLRRSTFEEWIRREGVPVLEDTRKSLPMRWFFGRRRARRLLYGGAKRALRKDGWFARNLARRLDQLPDVIRRASVAIANRGHKDLLSVSAERGLVVVPRAVVQNEFAVFLIEELSRADVLAPYRGLASRVLKDVAIEAEGRFFKHFKKGKRQFVDSTGKGAILGVDPEFGWRLNKVDGHYFYAYSRAEDGDLNQKKDLKRFRSEMEEVLHGQQVYLKRLQRLEVAAIADNFRH